MIVITLPFSPSFSLLSFFYSLLSPSPSLSFAHIVVDYSSDFIQKSLQIYDPPGLWDSTPTDRFPDPATELDAFLHYCNHSREHLTSFLYLVTREMAEKGEERDLKPLITHGPFVYSKLFK